MYPSRSNLDHQYPTFKLFGFLSFSRNRKAEPCISVAYWVRKVIIYVGPKVSNIGTASRPVYILFKHMDPEGYICAKNLNLG